MKSKAITSRLAVVALLGLGVIPGATAADVTVRQELTPLTAPEQKAFLKAHNDARKVIGLDMLEWSDDLAKYAAQWLEARRDTIDEQVKEGKLPNPGHRPHEGEFQQQHGENIAIWGGVPKSTNKAPEQAVGFWLKEKAAFEKLNAMTPYIVGNEEGKEDDKGQPIVVNHYTQIVWKDTKKIGAARLIVDIVDAKKKLQSRFVVIVCNYDPPGNIEGKKPY